MANNVAVAVSADVADLQAKMAVAKATMQDVGKTMREVARDVASGDTTAETRTRLLQVSEAYSKASNEAATYARQMRTSAVAVNDNTGQMRAGFQNLGFQLQDISVQFASGQRAATIFAQQLPQVSGALTQIAQAGGNASGMLGRFAAFMSGPYGIAVGIAAAVMPPLIAKLLETGNAADIAKEKVYGLQQALADLRSKPMQALGELQKNVFTAEGQLRAAEAMPRYTGGGSEEYKRNTRLEQLRSKAIDQAQQAVDEARTALEVAKATAKTNESLFSIQASAGRLKAMNIKDDDDTPSSGGRASAGRSRRGSRGSSSDDKAAAREAEQAAREELQERLDVTRQIEALAEDKTRTEISLSEIALQSKLSDIDAEQRAGRLSAAQAIQQRAQVNAQLLQLDQDLEQRLFELKLRELQADRKNYAAETREFRDYTRQIEALQQQHDNRMLILKRQADARQRQIDQALATEQGRRMNGLAGTWASNLARMATLQQNFSATVSGLWQGIAGVVEGVIAEMLQKWIVSQLIKIGLIKTEHATSVQAQASLAGAGGVASMAAAPFPINTTAPAFGAAMYGAAASFGLAGFADGTNQLPSDMIAQIHAGERIVPKADNDELLELTRRGAGEGGGGATTIHIHAIDARSFERFARNNKDAFGKAVKMYARNGGR